MVDEKTMVFRGLRADFQKALNDSYWASWCVGLTPDDK